MVAYPSTLFYELTLTIFRKISGMAIRHCVELGYHRNVSRYRKLTDPLVAEMSTRCFWVAYDLDRVAAFNLGRPVGIADDAIDVDVGHAQPQP
jgi:hypothetical protein